MIRPAKRRTGGIRAYLHALGCALSLVLLLAQPATATAGASPQPLSAPLSDPLLDQLLSKAALQNADLHLARARLQQARADAALATAERRPWLYGSLQADRRRIAESHFRDGEGQRHRVPPYRHNYIDFHLNAGYEIDLFGRHALRAASAEAQQAASEAEQRAVALEVRHAVLEAYADFRLATDLLALHDRAGGVLQSVRALTITRVQAGVDAPYHEREAAEAAEAIDLVIAGQAARQRSALARLAQLLGDALDTLPGALVHCETEYFAAERPVPALPAGLATDVIARRPDIAVAALMLKASQADAERVRLERYPSLTLTGTLGFVSESLSRWLRGEALAWLIGSALNGPLLDGGRNTARHAGALAASDAAEALWRRQVLHALAEVERSLAELSAHTTQQTLLQHQQNRLERALSDAQQAFAYGRNSKLQLLAKELHLLEHEARLRSTRRDHLVAWSASRLALGE